MWARAIAGSLASLGLLATPSAAVTFRVDFEVQFTELTNVAGDGASFVSVPADGRITGSYAFHDAPQLDYASLGPGSRELQYGDPDDAIAYVEAAIGADTFSITAYQEGPGSDALTIRLLDDLPELGYDDEGEYVAAYVDGYRVVGLENEADWRSQLFLSFRERSPAGQPLPDLMPGLSLADLPDLGAAPPSLQNATFLLILERPTGRVHVNGVVTALSLAVVPEPGTSSLVAPGLALMAWRCRRGRRSAQRGARSARHTRGS